jgi:hypothetical protein
VCVCAIFTRRYPNGRHPIAVRFSHDANGQPLHRHLQSISFSIGGANLGTHHRHVQSIRSADNGQAISIAVVSITIAFSHHRSLNIIAIGITISITINVAISITISIAISIAVNIAINSNGY